MFQAQVVREKKVLELWNTVLDSLDFMKEAEPLKVIAGLETTTQAIMKQIYECLLFLKNYEDRTFLSK
jgi:hypothetical protein